ncbi:MAG: CRTAC1 family protein [Phycisphaerales bacterium]|nr:MAG: CRTAC1 family protein [Phycisphaerales bacterium]
MKARPHRGVRRRIISRVLTCLASLAVIAAMPGGCRKSKPTEVTELESVAEVWFEDVAVESGITFVHVSGHRVRHLFPESVVGGGAMFDYDRDGDLDVYVVQCGTVEQGVKSRAGNKLYRNEGNGTFVDVTTEARVGDLRCGMGCTCADYDSDGDVDLYVSNYGSNVLYRNDGDGTFSDVTAQAGVGDPSYSASSGFIDYDRDGRLDLFVVNYVHWSPEREIDCFNAAGELNYCKPTNYQAPARDTVYHNLGNGKFEEVSRSVGIGTVFGNGLGLAWADFNMDGWMDVFVANDATPNQLWINTTKGGFVDEALIAGCSLNAHGMTEAGMGVIALDIENDGDVDLFMGHLRAESNTLYKYQDGWFEDATSVVGLEAPSFAFTTFGLGFADFDHDGYLDLYTANGAIISPEKPYDPSDSFAEPNLLYRGLGNDRFEEITPRGGTRELLVATSRGASFGDMDNDGDIDVLVVNKDARPHLLRNVADKRGGWIMFSVLDNHGSEALGATVRVDVGQRRQWRLVQATYSYCSSNDPRVHFGLGDAGRVDAVSVRWPDGKEESFGGFAASAVHTLRRGGGNKRQE